jgi:hypothetical protein
MEENMKRIFVIMIILLATVLLISCGNQQPFNDMPDMGIKAKNWNTSVKLADDPALSNSFRNGRTFTLGVENLSDAAIVFPNDFGIKLKTKDGKSWVNIPNNFYYAGQELLPTESSWPLGLVVSALPYIPDLTSPINIRIVIIGHTKGNDKELLGAYFDVTLNP